MLSEKRKKGSGVDLVQRNQGNLGNVMVIKWRLSCGTAVRYVLMDTFSTVHGVERFQSSPLRSNGDACGLVW